MAPLRYTCFVGWSECNETHPTRCFQIDDPFPIQRRKGDLEYFTQIRVIPGRRCLGRFESGSATIGSGRSGGEVA
jgi:hypothetical protein